jgi:hypothetical protein
VTAVGYKFTLILNREITDDESMILRNAGCADAIFGSDTLPTNAAVPVSKMDFDTTSFPTLADAIQGGLDAVMKVPDLSVPGLTVPAQPAGPETGEQASVLEGVIVQEEPAAPKSARKPRARKGSTKSAADPSVVLAATGSA